jgi:hypothetical protein
MFAYEQSEKYKEGKFIIERAFMVKVHFNNSEPEKQTAKAKDRVEQRTL